MSEEWDQRPIWIDPIGSEYRTIHPVPAHWVRYVPHDPAADELARLRAEVERLTKERDEADRIATLRGNHIEFRLLPQMMDLESALSDERRHADALAETLANVEYMSRSHAADDLLAQHRARRQG